MRQFHVAGCYVYETTGLNNSDEVTRAIHQDDWYGFQTSSFFDTWIQVFRTKLLPYGFWEKIRLCLAVNWLQRTDGYQLKHGSF